MSEIEKIKEAKNLAENKISGALLELRKETGLKVQGLRYIHHPENCSQHPRSSEKFNVFIDLII